MGTLRFFLAQMAERVWMASSGGNALVLIFYQRCRTLQVRSRMQLKQRAVVPIARNMFPSLGEVLWLQPTRLAILAIVTVQRSLLYMKQQRESRREFATSGASSRCNSSSR